MGGLARTLTLTLPVDQNPNPNPYPDPHPHPSANSTPTPSSNQDWKIEMFATPNTLRNVIADLQFYSKFDTDNELTIVIEDFDDGEGPMMVGSSPGNLRAEIKVGIFAEEEGADGGGGGLGAAERTLALDPTRVNPKPNPSPSPSP